MSDHTSDSDLIDAYGGTTQVAALCGLTTGAVSQWRTKGIPKAWREVLRLVRPKVFKAWVARQARSEKVMAAAMKAASDQAIPIQRESSHE